MYTLKPIIQSRIDLHTLSTCVDMAEADKHSSHAHAKLAYVSESLFSLDLSKQLISIAFYYDLPSDIADFIVNSNRLKIGVNFSGRSTYGIMSGTLADYQLLIMEAMRETSDSSFRAFANFLFNYFNLQYGMFFDAQVKHLPDKTFSMI